MWEYLQWGQSPAWLLILITNRNTDLIFKRLCKKFIDEFQVDKNFDKLFIFKSYNYLYGKNQNY
jgi:hypothetical protein